MTNQPWKSDTDGHTQRAFIRGEGHGDSGGGVGTARASKSQQQKAQKIRRRQWVQSPDSCASVGRWEAYSSCFGPYREEKGICHCDVQIQMLRFLLLQDCFSPSHRPKIPLLAHPLGSRERHPRRGPFRHRNSFTETEHP
jgi:hypothetical protein